MSGLNGCEGGLIGCVESVGGWEWVESGGGGVKRVC